MIEGDSEYAFRKLEIQMSASAADGDLHDVHLRFLLDLRGLPGTTGLVYCSIFGSYGAGCQPCPGEPSDTTAPSCVPFDLTWPRAQHLEDFLFQVAPTPASSC